LSLVSVESGCLLCFEADPSRCHRCYIADALAQLAGTELEIIHLGATKMPVVWPPTLEGIPTLQ
jgi:hypothetical protein